MLSGGVAALKAFATRLAKELVGRLVIATGAHRKLLKGVAIVVAFHSITRDTSDGALRCGQKDFDSYCRFFAKHLVVLPLRALIDLLRTGSPLQGQVVITFDDGYADNAELAAPILRTYNLRSAFYVTTGYIDTKTQTFWDQDARVRSRWMTWSQVRELASLGHEIGSHTASHADLATLRAEDVQHELESSRDTLVQRVGILPTHFAVPFGRTFSTLPLTQKIANRLGFESVCLCRGGIVHATTDVMSIERWPIDTTQYLSPYGWIADVIKEALGRKSQSQ